MTENTKSDNQNYMQSIGLPHCFTCHTEHEMIKDNKIVCDPPHQTSCTPACGKWYKHMMETQKPENQKPDWEKMREELREEFEELFPKDIEATMGIRPSKSNRTSALVLWAKWQLIVYKAVDEARQEGREELLRELALKKNLYGGVDYVDDKKVGLIKNKV